MVFSVGFWLESGKICKNNDHTCLFDCINTLGRCLNTQPNGLMFSFLRTQQMLMHEKTCVIPIFTDVLPNEPVHEISNNVVCATSKASDQPAHTGSLVRAFASRLSIL